MKKLIVVFTVLLTTLIVLGQDSSRVLTGSAQPPLPFNMIYQSGFENATTGWGVTGGVFTAVTDTALVARGKYSGKWTPPALTVAGVLFQSDATVIPPGLYNHTCKAQMWFKGDGSTNGTFNIEAYDGTNILGTASIPDSTYYSQVQSSSFTCPISGSLRLRIRNTATTVAVPTAMYFDDAIITDTSWLGVGSALTGVSTFGSAPNTAGASVSGNNLVLQPASATQPGGLSTSAQSIKGAKTFVDGLIADLVGDVTGDLTGNADTATALATTPTGCSPGQFASSIAANGNLTCGTPTGSGVTSVGATSPIASSGGTTPTISIQAASGSQDGALSSSDWTTFNDKQDAGNYITALTGDVTASGPGSVASTLATVNADVGTYANATVTVNAKGLITAASGGVAAVSDVTGTSPIVSSGGTTPAISIADAAADGATKGAASFTAADFNATTGNISIDYANGQKATTSVPGFLTDTDWDTFNNKLTSPLTTKGDILTYSTVPARLAVGTTGFCLLANSATATGLEWASCPGGGGGGMTIGGAIGGSSGNKLLYSDASANLAESANLSYTDSTGLLHFTSTNTASDTGALKIDSTSSGAVASLWGNIIPSVNSPGVMYGVIGSGDNTAGKTNVDFTGFANIDASNAFTGGTWRNYYGAYLSASPGTVTTDNYALYVASGNSFFGGNIVANGETASTIASFDGSKNLKSLALATYPSLTELSYVKGVTSAIQTQLDAKAPLASPDFTGLLTEAVVTDTATTGSNASITLGSGNVISLQNASLVSINRISAPTSFTTKSTHIRLINDIGTAFTIINNSGIPSGNRILTGVSATITVPTNGVLDLEYDPIGLGIWVVSSSSFERIASDAAGSVLSSSGSGIVTATGAGTSGQFLTSAGASTPTWTTVLPIANGGTNSTATATAGGIGYGTGTAHAYSSAGTTGQMVISGGTGTPTYRTFTYPTIQKLTSGSGTYTTAANAVWIKVRMVGAGGGGAGSSTTAADGGAGGAGGNTTFGTTLLVANGGGGGQSAGGSGAGGSGGTVSLGAAVGTAIVGGVGGTFGGAATNQRVPGGLGASSALGGSGGGGIPATAGGAGATNSGGGGAGAGAPTAGYSGSGGGSGGFVDAVILSPSATYSYAVGAAGTAGTAGTSGFAGGAGGSGYIEVTEYFQ